MYTNLRLMELFVLFLILPFLFFRAFLHDLGRGGTEVLEKSKSFIHVNYRQDDMCEDIRSIFQMTPLSSV